MKNRFFIPAVLLVLQFSLPGSGLGLPTIAQAFALGSQVPEISLPNQHGDLVRLSGLRGKLVLVDFWASWCGPCRRSNKELLKTYQQYNSAGFEILGISIDNSSTAWKKAIKADKISWLQVFQPGGWEAAVATQWGIDALPTSYLVDEAGNVLMYNPSHDQLEELLKKRTKQPD